MLLGNHNVKKQLMCHSRWEKRETGVPEEVNAISAESPDFSYLYRSEARWSFQVIFKLVSVGMACVLAVTFQEKGWEVDCDEMRCPGVISLLENFTDSEH